MGPVLRVFAPSPLAALAVTALLGVAPGCERATPPSPTTSTTVAAEPQVDRAGLCAALCERSTACSVEAAEARRKAGAATKETVDAVRRDAPDVESRCATGCSADDTARGLAAARPCLGVADCAAFESCLKEL
ncbi:MAG: hypothetical protein IT373_16340 [Polyangiaceae bacterium]|nr:hypothetical protein [Polyangiaceae bacterium]